MYKDLENKEGQKYGAWLQLDFDKRDKNNNHEVKQFHQNYGYDLKASLEKFPIREMKEPDIADILMQSLKKGNLQAVAVEKDGGDVRMFVEAAPQYKSVNIYDSELKRVPKEEMDKYLVEGKGKVNGQEINKGSGTKKEMDKSIPNEKGKGQSEKRKEKTRGPEVLLPKKNSPNKNKAVKVK